MSAVGTASTSPMLPHLRWLAYSRPPLEVLTCEYAVQGEPMFSCLGAASATAEKNTVGMACLLPLSKLLYTAASMFGRKWMTDG